MEVSKGVILIIVCIFAIANADNIGNSQLACNSYPCTDGQTCVETIHAPGYMCCSYIASRYVNASGHSCFPCDTHPCGKSGTCVVDNKSLYGYYCHCRNGTVGYSCGDSTTIRRSNFATQKPVNTTHNATSTAPVTGCSTSPCESGAVCVPYNNTRGHLCCKKFARDYMCCELTDRGYVNSSGQLCFPCSTKPCGRNGICQTDKTSANGYICKCPDGSSGQSCSDNIGNSQLACPSHPCTDGQTCVETIHAPGYMCCSYISSRYVNASGHSCFPCDTHPCGQNGTCAVNNRSLHGYYCHCPDGTVGYSCRDCAKNETRCTTTKKCIPKSYKCDDYLDCGEDDVSDELNCGSEGCRSDQFFCVKNQRCIPKTWVCDGDLDCGGMDFSDEKTYCGDTCGSQQFHCDSGKCISEYELCDGRNNCKDNSDEKPETCIQRACTGNDFSCGKGQCIPAAQVCDGKHQCRNGEDENSLMCAIFDCKDVTKFRCANGACVRKINVCDGYQSCSDSTEERRDFCQAWLGTFGNVPKWLKLTSNRTVFNDKSKFP